MAMTAELQNRCDELRRLHVPGTPLVLPNVWDVATARAVVDAGFPVVATTSAGVAAALGYEDHEHAPHDAMLAAGERIVRGVDVPVTIDAEAGYGLSASDLVGTLHSMGAAGCNLEDTDHATGEQRDVAEQAAWLASVRAAADALGYPLVINARVDTYVAQYFRNRDNPIPPAQSMLRTEALDRARRYVDAGADCVYPIALYEADEIAEFAAHAGGPVNILQLPNTPSQSELAARGVARISYASLLHTSTIKHFTGLLPKPAEG